MPSPFSFRGRIRPLRYAAFSAGLFFSQHVIVAAALWAHTRSPMAALSLMRDWGFYVLPFRKLVMIPGIWDLALILGLTYLLLAAWALAALAFQRAADANISEWIATFVVAPIIQLPVILLLCIVPSRSPPDRSPAESDNRASGSGWPAAAQGVLASMAMTLLAVAVSTLLFGVYSWGIFLVTPLVIGATTGYFANRRGDVGEGRTIGLAAGAAMLGGVALVLVGLDGFVCIVLAAPLTLSAAVLGALLGRAIGLYTMRPPQQLLSSFALLPLVFALEHATSATTSFETHQSVEVRASPDMVWNAIVRMDTIGEPPALPFRLGVAYPLRGEVIGEGVGALRRGEFSTGTALERVTEWLPNRKLAFVVLKDVPAMHELSPYEHVHAPHVVGYFRTTETSFELVPLPDGSTRIAERTSHELRLDPILYWLPIARHVVDANNARVLAHIRRQAERRL